MLNTSALVRSILPSPPDHTVKNTINPFLLKQSKKGFLVVDRNGAGRCPRRMSRMGTDR